MFAEVTNSSSKSENREELYRRAKLFTISTILLSASAGMSFASQYPALAVAIQSASVDRPCTQLELSADMIPAECGTLILPEVVSRIQSLETDNRDK